MGCLIWLICLSEPHLSFSKSQALYLPSPSDSRVLMLFMVGIEENSAEQIPILGQIHDCQISATRRIPLLLPIYMFIRLCITHMAWTGPSTAASAWGLVSCWLPCPSISPLARTGSPKLIEDIPQEESSFASHAVVVSPERSERKNTLFTFAWSFFRVQFTVNKNQQKQRTPMNTPWLPASILVGSSFTVCLWGCQPLLLISVPSSLQFLIWVISLDIHHVDPCLFWALWQVPSHSVFAKTMRLIGYKLN